MTGHNLVPRRASLMSVLLVTRIQRQAYGLSLLGDTQVLRETHELSFHFKYLAAVIAGWLRPLPT